MQAAKYLGVLKAACLLRCGVIDALYCLEGRSLLKDSGALLKLIVSSFHELFLSPYQTILEARDDEPLYQPKTGADDFHRIYFVKDNWSSALHEISHWCVAGPKRRLSIDYGYWYEPDGRTVAQQELFEKVEIKPQALEWIFTSAIKQDFFVSADNLNANCSASEEFKLGVYQQCFHYLHSDLPLRADRFLSLLKEKCQSHKFFEKFWQDVFENRKLPH